MNAIKFATAAIIATASVLSVSIAAEARPKNTPTSPNIVVPQGAGSVKVYRGRAPRMDSKNVRYPRPVGTCSSSNTERVCHFVQDKGNQRTVTVIRTPR